MLFGVDDKRAVGRATAVFAALCLAASLFAVSMLGLSPAFGTTGPVGWLADLKGHVTAFGGEPNAR